MDVSAKNGEGLGFRLKRKFDFLHPINIVFILHKIVDLTAIPGERCNKGVRKVRENSYEAPMPRLCPGKGVGKVQERCEKTAMKHLCRSYARGKV